MCNARVGRKRWPLCRDIAVSWSLVQLFGPFRPVPDLTRLTTHTVLPNQPHKQLWEMPPAPARLKIGHLVTFCSKRRSRTLLNILLPPYLWPTAKSHHQAIRVVDVLSNMHYSTRLGSLSRSSELRFSQARITTSPKPIDSKRPLA